MRFFIKKVLMFFTLPTMGILIFVFFVTHISLNYEVENNTENLIAGDSHLKTAINANVIPKTISCALVDESYYYTFYKIKTLVKEKSNISSLYLGFGHHNLSPMNDEITEGSYFNAAKFFYILPFREKLRVSFWNFNDFRLFTKNTIIFGVKTILNTPAFTGGFENSINKHASKDIMDKRVAKIFGSYPSASYSYYNLSYLDSIIYFVNQKDIKLYGVNTPIHNYYKSKIPDTYISKYSEIIKSKHLNVIDFEDINLNEAYFMPDGDHVNSKGAKLVTQAFKKEIGFN